jgi:hypothetical protein
MAMQTENDVIDAVCKYLIENNYSITQQLTTSQTGVDIVAVAENGTKCFVEAKGATSSKPTSNKYGKEFDKSQVKTHVGVALVAAFKIKNEFPNSESIIALPDNQNHVALIQSMKTPIIGSGIQVMFVSNNGAIRQLVHGDGSNSA